MTQPKPTEESIANPTTFEGIVIPPLPPAVLEPQERDLAESPDFTNYSIPGLEAALNNRLESHGLTLRAARPSRKLKTDTDLAIPAHAILRSPGGSMNTITQLRDDLQASVGDAVQIDQTGPFINARFSRPKLAETVLTEVATLNDTYGHNSDGNGETVVLDVSSPNIAKNMHLGHLRSTVIGEALTRILYANGYKTIRDNHLGDWGTQFGILAHAYKLWGNEVPELDDPETQVAGLQKLYVKINSAIADEKSESESGVSELEDEGRKWFTRLENGDPEAYQLWKWAWDLSMQEFEKVYEALGVNFEYVLGESVYAGMSPDVYNALEARGVAAPDEHGRLKLVPSDPALHNLTIRKSDGSSLYGTRDIAALCARVKWFDPAKIIYVVGNEQRDYFKQVFDGFKQLSGDKTPELEHHGFGAIELPEGKMSTRAGNVVFLSDVLNEAYERALQRVTANAEEHALGASREELETIAQQVAVGAVIYYDLKQGGDRKITFSWDEVLNFEGNSGPYLQYSHARMNALIDESQKMDISSEEVNLHRIEETGPEATLISLISEFPFVVREAGRKYEPAVLSEYLYRLAHNFNIFYSTLPILKESDQQLRANRLLITQGVKQVLSNGLDMLNIPKPSRM